MDAPKDRRQLAELIRQQIGNMGADGDKFSQKIAIVEQIAQAMISDFTALIGALNDFAVSSGDYIKQLQAENQDLRQQLVESRMVRRANP